MSQLRTQREVESAKSSQSTGCNKQDSDGLERLQRRAARIVMHSKDSDFSMKTLKWETLLERRQKHILSLVNKCLKKKVPQYF